MHWFFFHIILSWWLPTGPSIVASMALWPSHDHPTASEATLRNMLQMLHESLPIKWIKPRACVTWYTIITSIWHHPTIKVTVNNWLQSSGANISCPPLFTIKFDNMLIPIQHSGSFGVVLQSIGGNVDKTRRVDEKADILSHPVPNSILCLEVN